MTLLSATVSRVSTGVGGGAVVTNAFHSHNSACWYMRALNNNGKNGNVTKIEKYYEKENVSVSITKRCVK